MFHEVDTWHVCDAVFPGLCLSEAGQLLLLLLASFLSEQQLWLERGRGWPSVNLVRCWRNHWWVERVWNPTLDHGFKYVSIRFWLIYFLLGGAIQGLISDFMGKRAPVVIVSLVLAIGALWGYSREYKSLGKLWSQNKLELFFFLCLFRLAQWPGDKCSPLGQHWLLHRRSVCHDQLRHICRPGQTGSSAGEPGSFGHCHRNRGWNWEHRSSCRTGEDDE